MKITCPGCGFERDVDEAGLRPSAAVAVCPRCRERFRFRNVSGDVPRRSRDDAPEEERDAAGPPPDAVVPPDKRIPPGGPDRSDDELFSHPRDAAPSADRRASVPSGAKRDAEEDLRRHASEAYRRAAGGEPFPGGIGNPWEDPVDGHLQAFYQTIVRVLFAAPRFFAGLTPRRAILRPFLFYLLVSLVQISTEQFWLNAFAGFLSPDAGATGEESSRHLAQLAALLTQDVNIPMLFLARAAFMSLELLCASVLYYAALRCVEPKKTDFSLVFQVAAYASAPAVLGIVPLLGSLAGFIWSIVCVFVGCRHAVRITWLQTALALGAVYLIVLPMLFKLMMGL
jgi:hypothetical protein